MPSGPETWPSAQMCNELHALSSTGPRGGTAMTMHARLKRQTGTAMTMHARFKRQTTTRDDIPWNDWNSWNSKPGIPGNPSLEME